MYYLRSFTSFSGLPSRTIARTVSSGLLSFSLHGIAMPKGLYFTARWVFLLFLSFFRCQISEVTERISTKLGHIFTYDCYLKNLV